MISTETRIPGIAFQNDTPVVEIRINSQCRHHWLIERTDGPLSHGICKYCREERDFRNSLPEYWRELGTSLLGKPNRWFIDLKRPNKKDSWYR